ncbi:MAG: peptidylprolyl isomerase [Coriobacteriia bacterium]|nr:peptidylprolyl isomerase [Coriobacteriia bacterium]
MSMYTPQYKVVGDEVAVLETSKGTIKVKLDGEGAPIHVANFVELAEKGFYNSTKFHRYVPGFVIQGGDPHTKDLTPEEVADGGKFGAPRPGTGGPGYTIKAEFDTNPNNSHIDGALAMARSQHPDSAGSQFYFCLGAQHALDSGYTVFGKTLEGMDTIGALRAGDELISVTIEHL